MKLLSISFFATTPICLLISTVSAINNQPTQSKQTEHSFKTWILKEVQMRYLLYLPKDYGKEPLKKYPLILFLHGAGERGDDLELVKRHGIPKVVEKMENFPFIVVSPQCPSDSWWTVELEALKALLDEVTYRYEVDPDRIYLTGLSMGGFGTWAMAIKYPDLFAAIAPICGGGDPNKVCAIKHVPVWVSHGAKDNVVPLEQSEKMVKALQQCGGNVKFTVYPDAEHDSWTVTYDNPELYDWLLKQSKTKR